MALIQTVHLSMANFKSAPVVPAVQNDTDRQVKMILDDYTLTSGLTGKIAFERSDGTHYETAAELVLADNAFTADIDQALTQPGRTMVQLKVTDVNTVSTFSFVVFVEADNSGTVTPQEGIDLVTAVEAAEAAADRAESAAETLELDATLTSPTKAAQAKAVGDAINNANKTLEAIKEGEIASKDGVDFWGNDGTKSKMGLTITQSGTIITIDGTYTASARRRFNLSGNLEDGTSVGSSWYSTAKAPIKNGAVYQVHLKPISGTITYPSGSTGPAFNVQTYSTSGANDMNAYVYADRISEPLVVGDGISVGCVFISINKDYIFNNYKFYLEIVEIDTSNSVVYINGSTGDDTASGSKIAPLKTISKALSCGFRKLRVAPGVYNETVSLSGGNFELSKWDDAESYSDQFRSKVEILSGTELTITNDSGNIYKASYTADSESNIYKVFVSHVLTPTTMGSITLEYNAMLVGNRPETASGNNKQKLYLPVLTEAELTDEGTFWYDNTNHVIKFHPWGNTLESEYYIPKDDASTIIYLTQMDSIRMEDVRVLGAYTNCMHITKSANVSLTACEFAFCGKGNGLRFDNANAVIVNCHASACAADGFNIHEYGDTEFYGCGAFYCGDDGISHHQGCTGVIDGGEWAYCGTGSGNGAGIAPTFGSKINLQNCYVHNNHLGIMQEGLSGKRRTVLWSSLVVLNNDTDLYMKYYDVIGWNCSYQTKNIDSYATFTEYNNNIVA